METDQFNTDTTHGSFATLVTFKITLSALSTIVVRNVLRVSF